MCFEYIVLFNQLSHGEVGRYYNTHIHRQGNRFSKLSHLATKMIERIEFRI